MATLFTKIINGEIPGAIVYEDDRCVAFLDALPQTEGHTLVVPREEISHWIDVPADLLAHLMDVAQCIGAAQKRAFDCERIGVLIQGYEVPHTHVHVWPTNSVADFDMHKRASEMQGPETLKPVAQRIRDEL